ncbi:SEL1-like repeat protein [Larsenimonas rhizosphaerae]|uniref:Sel1 repeat family protein n=1 Tax=Larsenimonas rhizosphaerae TaxID=2944682 RepID=A0AA41ZGY4_9GAMM|nr:sel1 repeat family protein [Larsenimonas rhizosphaerae]MCX2525077.1 sel1 repeat family protein [Larsenimonas rhizosphaerae]
MLQAASLVTRLEYRLAERLLYTCKSKNTLRWHRLSMRLFKRCADAGHVNAQSMYGLLLFRCGASSQEKARGARFVIMAAEAGDIEAQYHAARIFEFGCAQYAQRDSRAVTWFARAAEAGHEEAAVRLARAYTCGELGLQIDPARADYWESRVVTTSDVPAFSARNAPAMAVSIH